MPSFKQRNSLKSGIRSTGKIPQKRQSPFEWQLVTYSSLLTQRTDSHHGSWYRQKRNHVEGFWVDVKKSSLEIAIGSYVRCKVNNWVKNFPTNLYQSWRVVLKSDGPQRQQEPPEWLRLAASPWDEKTTQDQQVSKSQSLRTWTAGFSESSQTKKA